MCLHNGKRNLNGECDYPIDPPTVDEGDTILFDEPGRCSPQVNGTGSTDYHAYHFRYVKNGLNPDRLLVRHGGGQESIDMGFSYRRIAEIMAKLDSDARFLLFVAFMETHHDAAREATKRTADRYIDAFVKGNLKKRKIRGTNTFKVWIVNQIITGSIAPKDGGSK